MTRKIKKQEPTMLLQVRSAISFFLLIAGLYVFGTAFYESNFGFFKRLMTDFSLITQIQHGTTLLWLVSSALCKIQVFREDVSGRYNQFAAFSLLLLTLSAIVLPLQTQPDVAVTLNDYIFISVTFLWFVFDLCDWFIMGLVNAFPE